MEQNQLSPQETEHSDVPHNSLRTFLHALQEWVDAVERHRSNEADVALEKLKIFGTFRAEDPAFKAMFQRHLDGCNVNDTERVADCTIAFLHAIKDAALNGTRRR